VSQRLVAVVADKHIEQAVLGILSRPKALGIQPLPVDLVVHPNRDPGCFQTAHEILSAYATTHSHALVIFDRAWEGAPFPTASALEEQVESRLRSRWGDQGRCVVIDPEVEAWVWSTSPHVGPTLGWTDLVPTMRDWLAEQNLWPEGAVKPPDPKAALQRVLHRVRQPRSSAIFRRLGSKVSLAACQDPTFNRLVSILRGWFAEPSHSD
jgi:hypothetical protein